MSKTWYPMIDYEKCTECGTCIDMCPYGVYEKEKAPRPIVVNSDECGQGYIGCGSTCPSEAISYFGDTENSARKSSLCCEGGCDCSASSSSCCSNSDNSGCGCGCN